MVSVVLARFGVNEMTVKFVVNWVMNVVVEI